MLDMLNQDSRAAIGRVKQLQQQGMPADQIDAQMSEAARNGLLPLSVAFAAQKMLQRTQQAANPVQAPQGTVVNDMIQQIAAQRNQGVAGLANPIMDNAEFAGGGVVAFSGGGTNPPAPRRRRGMTPNKPDEAAEALLEEGRKIKEQLAADAARREAMRGGIAKLPAAAAVAPQVAKGLGARALGALTGPWGIAASIGLPLAYAMFKGDDEKKPAAAAAPAAPTEPVDISSYFGQSNDPASQIAALQGSGAPGMGAYDAEIARQKKYYQGQADESKLGDEDQYIDERMAREKKYGIGAADAAVRARNEARRKEQEADYKKGAKEDIAMGFLDEGIEAAQRGEGTVASLMKGFVGGKKKTKARKEEYNAARDKLDQLDAQLDMAQEARTANNISGGVADYKERKTEIRTARERLDTLSLNALQTRIAQEGAALGRDLQLKLAQISASSKGTPYQRRTEELIGAFINAGKKHDKAAQAEISAQLEELTQLTSPQYQTEGLKQEGSNALIKQMLARQAGEGGGGEAAASDTDKWTNYSAG
jgi:hypothetical protein